MAEHETRDVPESVPSVQPSSAIRWGIVLPLIILVVAGGGYFGVQWWIYAVHHVSTDDARVKGRLITISSQVSGRLISVPIEDGQRIKKGDLLAQLQPDAYRAKVALREAALEAVQSQLANAETDLDLGRRLTEGHIERSDAVLGASRSQLVEAKRAAALESQRIKANLREKEAAVEEVKAQLSGAKVNLDKAEADLQRAKQLFQDGIIATEQRERMVALYDQARARYESSQEALNKSFALLELAKAEGRRVQLLLDNVRTQRRKVRESKALKTLAVAERQRSRMKAAMVKNLRAKVKEAEAELTLARIGLEETRIFSPIDGVVSQAIADPGEYVQPGQPIAIINDPQDVWIEANIEETEIRDIRVGQPVEIDVDAYPHQKFQGKVWKIGAATRSEFAIIPAGSASAHFIKVTQRLPVKITTDNRLGLLKPGMMVAVGIRVK
ncbi:MAG: HlyD family secretion protein [bacterium]|nr:HlyD family secretion protein [bacterium]